MSVMQLITAMENNIYSASELFIVETANAFARLELAVDLLAWCFAMADASLRDRSLAFAPHINPPDRLARPAIDAVTK